MTLATKLRGLPRCFHTRKVSALLSFMSVLRYLVSRPLSSQSFRSKSVTSSAVSKRTVTKKKYAELPALSLHALCEHPTDVSNTPLSLDLPERALFAILNVCGRLLTWSWPFPPFVAAISPSTQRARRRRVRRVEATVNSDVLEPAEQSIPTREARNVAGTAKRSRKALPPTPTGKACEWRRVWVSECPNC